MNPRERVLASLGRAEPDRVPLFYRDVPEVEARLIRELGLRDSEDILRFLRIDFRWVSPAYVGPPLEDARSGLRRDIWGVRRRFLPGAHTQFAGRHSYQEHPGHV